MQNILKRKSVQTFDQNECFSVGKTDELQEKSKYKNKIKGSLKKDQSGRIIKNIWLKSTYWYFYKGFPK